MNLRARGRRCLPNAVWLKTEKRDGIQMILIVAVDDNNGMMFNKRRQSQDRVLRERIIALSAESRLWMNRYTEKQFTQDGRAAEHICVDDDFMTKAAPGEYSFVENIPAAPYEKLVERIVIFKWNRKYPGDFYFDIDLESGPWHLASKEEFPGSSHEKITMEVYSR